MSNIRLAREARKITKNKQYCLDNKQIQLPELDYSSVLLLSPEDGKRLIEEGIENLKKESLCSIRVTNEDSFAAARAYERPLVLNFANAHVAGGAFAFGGSAQEESLCRQSTLYASISSGNAAKMYLCNNLLWRPAESDYMLLSPNVAVFRGNDGQLLEAPFLVSVITAAAPNRRGLAFVLSGVAIEKVFLRRIRIMLALAARKGYKNLVLGAWGCGAFGNKAEKVAEYFRSVIVDEGYGRCFDEICFAIYGSKDSVNMTAFESAFGKNIDKN